MWSIYHSESNVFTSQAALPQCNEATAIAWPPYTLSNFQPVLPFVDLQQSEGEDLLMSNYHLLTKKVRDLENKVFPECPNQL